MCIIKAKTLHIEGYRSSNNHNNPSSTKCWQDNFESVIKNLDCIFTVSWNFTLKVIYNLSTKQKVKKWIKTFYLSISGSENGHASELLLCMPYYIFE